MTPPHIVIFYNCIPHYRKAFFEKLSASEDLNVTFLADDTTDTKHMEVIASSSDSMRIRPVRTKALRLLGKTLFAHPGILKALRQEKPDMLIPLGNPHILTTWLIMLWGRIHSIPVVLWTHGTLRKEHGIKRLFRLAYYRLSAGLFLYGAHAQQLLQEMGLKHTPMYPIYNSLDYEAQRAISEMTSPEDISKFRESLGIGTASKVLIFTGRLQPVKKLDLLVKLTKRLNLETLDTHCILIGDGDERERLQELALTLGVADKFHFLGAVHDEEKLGLAMLSADLYVIPSGAGLSVMHALGYGVPVLLHDNFEHHFPEWEAVEHCVNGLFYRENDMEDMIDKAISYLTGKHPEIQPDACYRAIEAKYTAEKQYRVILPAIREILGK